MIMMMMMIILMMMVSFQDFQLVFDLLARSYAAMARYILLATIEQADLDGDGKNELFKSNF